jgi:integrase/recombinase XerD
MADGTALVLPGTDEMSPHLLAAASFLMSFTNVNTRSAYALDLRLYFEWCQQARIDPFRAKRFHLQAFANHLSEVRKNAPTSVSRRVGTVSCYYDCAIEDGYTEINPTTKVRLPRTHIDVSKMVWLNRFELGALLKAARESKAEADWALIALMGTLGLRVTATCDINIEHFSTTDLGYKVLRTVGKYGKPSAKVVPIPVWEAVKHAKGGRTLALQAGVDIRVVQQGMDHSSTRATLLYDALGVELHAQASNTVAALLASSSAG